MFQTEILIFLQSFANDFITSIFKFFTETGRSSYAAPLIVIVLFGISFRAGFILLQVTAWNGLITMGLKEIFALPRPSNVDSNVLLPGEDFPNPTHNEGMGSKSFFGGLPPQVVENFRSHPFDSWGFPSGHTSHSVALWGSVFLFFKKKWVRIICLLMMVFIPLSRMYLGRHFLADVLGGYVLGLIMLLIFLKFVYRNKSLMNFLFEERGRLLFDLKSFLLLFYLFIMPLMILAVPEINPEYLAFFLGFNFGFLLIWFRGIPKDSGNIAQRFARTVIAGVLFFVLRVIFIKTTELLFIEETVLIGFFRQFFSIFLFFWGSTELCIKLGLYKRFVV